jgi:oligopeptide/dipeptide ABC transporter ATP-binding protein
MYLGRIVEIAPTEELFQDPQHPYTKALLAAAPIADPRRRNKVVPLAGETPGAARLPVGCVFQDRCPLVHDVCRTSQPLLEPSNDLHDVECFAVPTSAALAGNKFVER